MFATERFCDFVCKDPLRSEEATDAAYWFDFKVKQCSNLEKQMLIAIDYMLNYGHGLLKITWDVEAKRLCYYPIMPLFLIVPSDCDEICYCDRMTHVRHFTPWQYKHGPESKHLNQDEALDQADHLDQGRQARGNLFHDQAHRGGDHPRERPGHDHPLGNLRTRERRQLPHPYRFPAVPRRGCPRALHAPLQERRIR